MRLNLKLKSRKKKMAARKKTIRAAKNLSEVRDRIEARKEHLRERFKVKSIAVFGSFTQGKQKRGSDIDLLVEFEEVPGLDFFALWDYLEGVLRKKIDLTTASALRKELAEKVLKEAVYL